MSLTESRAAQMFPILTPLQRQIALGFASGPTRHYAPHEVVFRLGDSQVPALLIFAGRIDAFRRTGLGEEHLITSHHEGGITGEIAQLAGRASLAEGRAGPEGCCAAAFDAAHLRALVVGSAEIGEIIMRAFILRRTALIADRGAGSVIVGSAVDPWVIRLEGFLSRNGYPYMVMDPVADPDAAAIVERFALTNADLPIAICPNGTLLKRPIETELGVCLGITPELDPAHVYDVAVVGAGPAGLATAVYAASEGLSTLVLDARAFGGQAGASARIENYFGFPTGISGQALTARAFTQAQKFGAEIAVPLVVARLDCGGHSGAGGLGKNAAQSGADAAGGAVIVDRAAQRRTPLKLTLTDGQIILARSVVIASGVQYRRPAIPNLQDFEGAGVAYWASAIEARLCEGEEVALVGGGNSAGQAAVFLANKVKRLHLIVRGAGLESSMSRYLIDRIAALPNVELHRGTEVIALGGEPGVALSEAVFRKRESGATKSVALRHLFLFIGADANTGWLQGCAVALDDKKFVLTGARAKGAVWTALGREPLPLETSVPGVFAIGDVRAGSTKRVAAAVGEGAAVVAQLHAVLDAAQAD